jgi:hypothetical protein
LKVDLDYFETLESINLFYNLEFESDRLEWPVVLAMKKTKRNTLRKDQESIEEDVPTVSAF